MLQSLRKETEGKLPNAIVAWENGLTSLFKEVRVFKVSDLTSLLRNSFHVILRSMALCI